MEESFWRDRWQSGRIGFHASDVNPNLARHAEVLSASGPLSSEPPPTILVPLCGKSVDLAWLAGRGHRVIGVEIIELAAVQFFDEHGLDAEVAATANGHVLYRSGPIEIICADFLNLEANDVGPIGAAWDRAALVALPTSLRPHYAAKLLELIGDVPLLLNSFTYDARVMDGPPFSVEEDEIRRHFATRHVEIIDHNDVIERVAFKERGHTYWYSTVYAIR